MADNSEYSVFDWLDETKSLLTVYRDLGHSEFPRSDSAYLPETQTSTGIDNSMEDNHNQSSPAMSEGLAAIREQIGDCQRCKLSTGRNKLVFGAGNPNARLMFVGEGPGRDEDLQGEPFVGRAGELLTKIIVAMGLSRSDVYIANIIKCRPPKNRDPETDEIEACIGFLYSQIEAIRPEIIVCLGAPSTKTLLDTKAAISKLRGHFTNAHGTKIMPTYHPAYLLRNPSAKKFVWDDIKIVMAELGLELPQK
jgi:uracil-DNA glycosylase